MLVYLTGKGGQEYSVVKDVIGGRSKLEGKGFFIGVKGE